jgi:hypothetical protein
MHSSPTRILALLFVCLGSTFIPNASAQNIPDATQQQTSSCKRWMQSAVHATPMIDPELFCAGLKTGNTDGWDSTRSCPRPPENSKGSAPKYCVSVGYVMRGDTLAVAFTSRKPDGGDFFFCDRRPSEGFI